ncbi:MAG: aminotransferase class V-fold PLP-dependent enzyme, partial [Acidobacteriota bacterium]
FPGAVALAASVDLVNTLGIERIENHIQHLVERLLEGLDHLGLRIVSPREREQRAGIVSFRAYRSPQRDWELVEKLMACRIVVSMRYTARVGGIRVSLHYFNNEDDVDRLLEALRELK